MFDGDFVLFSEDKTVTSYKELLLPFVCVCWLWTLSFHYLIDWIV